MGSNGGGIYISGTVIAIVIIVILLDLGFLEHSIRFKKASADQTGGRFFFGRLPGSGSSRSTRFIA